MRNLQKILALVLALVMSLSLMATAGAKDFTDGDQIDDTFAESVDVLTGLEVFQGYPTGDFQPKGDITRAEVAAIIYRIATGDVSDSQVGIYANYNKFSDVPSDNWAAGYINYCANAEYIKGRGDGKFYPSDKVTGYEALAMILRVVGYDKNGEFTGRDWQVQTAAIANQRKVTKNVNSGMLNDPASREMVAELLCQAILINTVNYTLAYGYQISTNDQDTIAYQTFKMEMLTGVVTGNEIADLKTDKGTALGAGQSRLVIDGREEVVEIPTGLEDLGMRVRAYIRPKTGTNRNILVTRKVYSDGLNHVYDNEGARLTSSNLNENSPAEAIRNEGITSLKDAEHFVNYDYANEWTAKIRITYDMKLRMSDYEAHLLVDSNDGDMWVWDDAANADGAKVTGAPTSTTDTIIRAPSGTYNYHYRKTIEAFKTLTDTDWDYLRNYIFAKADFNNSYVIGEVYVGTNDGATKDVSDEIRWEDFVSAYLQGSENRAQISTNGLGCRLRIIDNDYDGVADYILQTQYTVAKVAANGTGLDIAALKLTDGDSVNEVSASDKITVVSGINLEASEDTVSAGDVVIYAKIDGKVRAQKAESETSRVTSINRAVTPVTATIESGEKKQSWVHGQHSDGLGSGLTNMVIGTNYTVYFDLYGNIAAYTEGEVGNYVLITDGWFNQTATAREWAVQAYIDGALQTVNITNNGDLFIKAGNNNNRWGMLKDTEFGGHINTGSTNTSDIHTIVALLEGNNLVPVDKSYTVDHGVRMLDMKNNAIPNRSGSKANAYETAYGANATAYTVLDGEVDVFGRSDTVYYYVWKDGTTNYVTGQDNIVVRTYTGCDNTPSINSMYIEDVYAVGRAVNYNNANITGGTNFTADVVVVELNRSYKYTNTNRDQVFIPGATIVNNSAARVSGFGIESVPMILNDGTFKEDVQVDLTHSTGYNAVNTSIVRIEPGLYYLDSVDTNANVYTIHRMSAADIRANNYLTGYVSQDTIMENNYVRVDVQMPIYDINGVAIGTESSSLNTQTDAVSKTVNTENLYTLSYSSNIANLSKASAATVFDQWKDRNLTNGSTDKTNELYDVANRNFPAGLSNRNEVLVRYSGNNVVWAISFAEKNGNNQNYAQTVWFNNLIARDNEVDSNLKFFGIGLNDELRNQVPLLNRVDANGDRHITINYADAAETPVIDLTNAYAATIKDSTLTKWTGADYTQRVDVDTETKSNSGALTGDVKYRLVVTFVSGGSETWFLTLKAANGDVTVNNPVGTTVDNTRHTMNVTDTAMTIAQFITRVEEANPGKTFSNWRFINKITGIDITDYDQGNMSAVGTFSFTVTADNTNSVDFTGITADASDELKKVDTMKTRVDEKVANKNESDQMNAILSDAYDKYQKDLLAAGNDAAKAATAKRELQAALNIVDSLVELVNYPAFNIHNQGITPDTAIEIKNALEQFGRHFGIGDASTGDVTLGGRVPELATRSTGNVIDAHGVKKDSVGNMISATFQIDLKSTGEEGKTVNFDLSAITKTFEWEWKLPVDSIFGTPEDVAIATKPVAEDRQMYAAAYQTAGLETTINGNTVTVTTDKEKLTALAKNALNPEQGTAAERDAIKTMQPSSGVNKDLHYGVAFSAPAMATSVKVTVKKGSTTLVNASSVDKGSVETNGIAFTNDGMVRDYIPVVDVESNGAYEIIDADQVWTYELQFMYGDLKLGGVQTFTVNVKAPVAAE